MRIRNRQTLRGEPGCVEWKLRHCRRAAPQGSILRGFVLPGLVLLRVRKIESGRRRRGTPQRKFRQGELRRREVRGPHVSRRRKLAWGETHILNALGEFRIR